LLLEKLGHQVTVAGDGQKALAVLEQSGVDLALMDIEMPVMGGLEATAAIRALERQSGGHLPIIAMTAHMLAQEHQRFREAGMDDVLTKPLQRDALVAAVARWATTQ
jgi:CheY-like chemotaxis protein